MKRTLAVLIEAPIPKRIKARLCPPLDATSAAQIYESFIQDTLERISSVPDTEVVIYYNKPYALSILSKTTFDAERYLPQKGRTIKQKVHYCFEKLCEPGRGVILTWTDSPTLPVRSFELAFDALASGEVDVVLGPTDNDGCYLIGTTYPNHNRIFDLESTALFDTRKAVEKAACVGLRWYLLPSWYMVRQPENLYRLKNELLKNQNGNRMPKRTKSCILDFIEKNLI